MLQNVDSNQEALAALAADSLKEQTERRNSALSNGQGGHRIQLIEFRLGSEFYALSIDDVKEVVLTPSVARVPQAPYYVMGVANIRGTIITIVDLEKRIEVQRQSSKEALEYRYTLVLELDGYKVGILVDQVPNTLNVTEDDINLADETMNAHLSDNSGNYLKGIVKSDDRMIFMLDIKSLIK